MLILFGVFSLLLPPEPPRPLVEQAGYWPFADGDPDGWPVYDDARIAYLRSAACKCWWGKLG
jgi:hypothetical protein